uniref:sodium-coupled monocarboxylate transporter 1-like n=1 Tax=Ciona intestinalis TaxID=7719 RepID=UPI000180C8C8|nr:sodium-coupled monocarboxylate transporter 1-like [Ciona intestinalis]|eukprot:XP_009860889.2 sodium-coupled monocarboxylate transporter 1-like [Ciona intestinalis]
MDETEPGFGVADYIVFFGMLIMATAIGAYYAFKDRNKKTVENYYFGNKRMSPIPVALSLSVTFISSITVLGYPAYAYLMGTVVFWFSAATLVQIFGACFYYIPLFHRLQLPSVYELLEIRFHRSVRLFASSLVIFNTVTHMAFTLYVTSLALTSVSPISLAVSILLTSGICTLYTTIGGMKAVIWTDTLQAFIMVSGSMAVFIKIAILLGGTDKIWEAVERGHRNTVWDFNPDPTLVHTFWTIMVGVGISWSTAGCCNQAFVQRYQTCESVRDARIASILSGIPMSLLLFIAALNGCAMYAYYEGCDPLTAGKIIKIDQTVPYLVLQIFAELPGMAGLFVSAAYSGMLSTVSSGINAVSGLVLADFLLPCFPRLREKTQLNISKLLGFVVGGIVTTLAFLTEAIGSTIIQLAVTAGGAFSGPLLGVYTMAIFFPWINALGAIFGMTIGFGFSMWVTIAGTMYQDPTKKRVLPLNADQCMVATTNDWLGNTTNLNSSYIQYATMSYPYTTMDFNDEVAADSSRPYLADSLYSISYLYLGALGLVATLVTGLLVSCITGFKNPKMSDPRYFVPFIESKYLPEKVNKFFRFGVPELDFDKKPAMLSNGGTNEKLINFLEIAKINRTSDAELTDGLDVATV